MFLTVPLIFYFNKKNKAFWTGIGQLVAALSNFLPLLAYLCIPSSYVDIQIGEREVKLCDEKPSIEDGECLAENMAPADWRKTFALGLFFVTKLSAGLASQTYWTLGIAYMDDNVRNMAAPAVLGVCYMAGYLGGFLGSLLASACLNEKIGADLLGAWWLGWPIIGSFHLCLSFGFLLLPWSLPLNQEVKIDDQEESIRLSSKAHEEPDIEEDFQMKDIWIDLKRLFQNRTLMFDSLAMAFFLFSVTNRSYISKFVEFQFLISPSAASLFSGSSSMIGMIVALGISIVVISWFKPSARSLALFNFLADIISMVVGLAFIFIDCDTSGVAKPESCFDSCGCGRDYKPVCDEASSQTFFSACAAGCSAMLNSTFTECSCSSGVVIPGYCPTNCNTPLKAFLITGFVLSFITGLGRVGNLLVHVRCVDKKDKALGMAIQEVCLALFAFIPGEVLFGTLVDSACNLWVDQGCGKSGNCLGYDMPDLRLKLFGVAAVGNGVAAVFDGLVWRNVKNLAIY